MRLTVMSVLFFFALVLTCRAEDPLESLNTVKDTLSELAHYRAAHGSPSGDALRAPSDPAAASAAPGGSSPEVTGAETPASDGTSSCCQESPAAPPAPLQ